RIDERCRECRRVAGKQATALRREEEHMKFRKLGIAAASAVFAVSTAVTAADEIPVGHLVAYTGPTSDVGVVYGQGVEDAVDYINANGGINGTQIKMPTVDYGYEIPRAIAAYKRWESSLQPVAIQG